MGEHRTALSAAHREALIQTLAAEALEGWRPTDENTDDLVDLLVGHLAFGDYLAKYLARARESNGRPRRKIIARRRPYLIPGTTVLRNNFDVDSPAVLAELEFVSTAGRLVRLHTRDPDAAPPGPRQLHQAVFADVYPWAGELRITDLRRGDSIFASVDILAERMVRIEALDRETLTADPTDSELAYRFAHLYALYNHTHPFREGNGRTGTVYLQLLAAQRARLFDLTRITRAEWIAASRDSMPFRRDGVPDHRPFLGIMGHALVPRPF